MDWTHFSNPASTSKWGGYQGSASYSGRISLRQIRLDRGGYANRGRDYYGSGRPLFRVEGEGEAGPDFTMRANDRDDAKRQVREAFPYAKIR